MNDHDRAMTLKEVARFLNISTQMVYNLVNNGSLKAFKIGSASRIMYSDVREFIEQQKEEFARTVVGGGQPDNSIFAVSNLCLHKGNFEISDISFSLPKGKIMSILGPSGSGKSLLLKALAGLEPIENGTIFWGKTRIDALSPSQRKVGFVFENYALFPHLNARKNIEFPLTLRKKDKQILREETQKRIHELDIDMSYLNLLPDELPEGMKQLVAIARGKNHDLDLFLMDEPMSKLDAAHHVKMRVFIQKIVRDLGKTTLISFNDPEDALVLSDYIGVVVEGGLLQFGETWEVYHHPVNVTVMEMISRLGVNAARVEVKNGNVAPYNILADIDDGIYTMAFRTEEIELSPDGIHANICSSQFYNGKRKFAFCEIGDGLEMELMLPIDAEGEISFLPLSPQFFSIGEDA